MHINHGFYYELVNGDVMGKEGDSDIDFGTGIFASLPPKSTITLGCFELLLIVVVIAG